MAIPVGAHGNSANYVPRAGARSTQNQRAVRRATLNTQSANRNSQLNADYLRQLQMMLSGGGYPQNAPSPGGWAPGGGGSRYGGGGGYDYAAAEAKRQAELDKRKADLTKQLQGARGQALPLLGGYYNQYNKDIGGIFNQNRAQTGAYSNQLRQLQGQMNAGTAGTQQMLQRDLQGQGAGAPDLQALLAQATANRQGTDFLSLLAQQYNTRLAQTMAQRAADAKSMGAAVNASSKGQLENSYANLLAQIGMIGLS